MKFSEAKQEFDARYYLWKMSEAEKEINESFPNLRMFHSGPCWELYLFMQQLFKSQQLNLSHGLVKAWHEKTLRLLGQNISPEEDRLTQEFVSFRSQFYGIYRSEVGPSEVEPSGQKTKYASKAKVRKLLTAKFISAYGSRCIKTPASEDKDPNFEMKVAGWIVGTRFIFTGKYARILQYDHSIESEETIPNPPFPPELWMPAMRLEYPTSFGHWHGLGGTIWEYLLPEEVEPACDMVIKFCGQFYDALPELLKGLEIDKITAN